jgi:hypothetical protein
VYKQDVVTLIAVWTGQGFHPEGIVTLYPGVEPFCFHWNIIFSPVVQLVIAEIVKLPVNCKGPLLAPWNKSEESTVPFLQVNEAVPVVVVITVTTGTCIVLK